MEDVVIRQCTLADINGIFELEAHWEQENVSYEFIPVSREEFISGMQKFQPYYLVAESSSQIVGYINASIRVNTKLPILPDQGTYLEIENIYVLPAFRNQHTGGKLIERLLEIAAQNGIDRFFVSTVTKDMASILRFYQSYGFKPWYVELFK